jgi:chorismate dehydratase
MLNIAAVSYLNTKPYLSGIKKYLNVPYHIYTFPPRECAEKLKNKEANMGLIPVATLPELHDFVPVSDFGIMAQGKVYSVSLFSQVSLSKITHIFLDYQSRTSVALTQILCQKFWGLNPVFIPAYPNYEKDIQNTYAGVIIGDRAIHLKSRYQYDFDLSEAWYQYTQLPFVFAVWVIHKDLYTHALHNTLNEVFQKGIIEKEQYYTQWAKEYQLSESIVSEYLSKYIQYEISPQGKKGMNLFLNI